MTGLQGIPSLLVPPILFYLLLHFLSLSSSLLPIQVVARGQLLFHQSVESRGSSAVLEVTVSARHTPRFQVVCYVAQEDGEIVGDVLEIETECSLENKVGGAWEGVGLEKIIHMGEAQDTELP